MSIHDLDMARFFVPDIIEVSAAGANVFCDYIEEVGDFDSVVITLRGRNGELVTITNSRHSSYGYDQRLEAFGSEGMLNASNIGPHHGPQVRRRRHGRSPTPTSRSSWNATPGLPERTGQFRQGHPQRHRLQPGI